MQLSVLVVSRSRSAILVISDTLALPRRVRRDMSAVEAHG